MKKILFIIFIYIIVKIILTIMYILTWEKEDIFTNYICWHNEEENICNIFQYSFNSTFWTVSDVIAYWIILLTIIIYFIVKVIKKIKRTK